jgi:hypothetical protein
MRLPRARTVDDRQIDLADNPAQISRLSTRLIAQPAPAMQAPQAYSPCAIDMLSER